MITEQVDPRYRGLDARPAEEIVRLMAEAEESSARAVAKAAAAVAESAAAAADSLERGGRLILIGAGTSGRLAVAEAAECPPTFGVEPDRVTALIAGGLEALVRAREGAEDDAKAGADAVAALGADDRDTALGITAGGATPFVLGALEAAARVRARTGLVTSNPGAGPGFLTLAPIVLEVGPEVVAGSTRLKSATAAKIALNCITTAAMARLGRLHDNLMVDMRPTNAKLRRRAASMVSMIAGVDEAGAVAALDRCAWAVKPAALAALGLDPGEAARRLEESGGNLRQALRGLKPD